MLPIIFLDPNSGPVGTSVDIAGAGFDPSSTITIEFDGSIVATVTSTPNGGFNATFNVPLSSSIGDQTVKATQGSNSASKTFTVTSLTTPIIVLDLNSGPVGTQVNVTGKGYAPTSTINITFDAIPLTTNPSTVNTNANGEFRASFVVPSSSIGQGSTRLQYRICDIRSNL